MRKFGMSFVTAFSLYSRIPMPQIQWKKDDQKYCLCAFPFIGIVIGLVQILLQYFAESRLAWKDTVIAVILAIVPVLVTGGIHVDGFMDTCDAKSSFGDKEKKRQILSDPHIGAFAVIQLVVYIALYMVGMWNAMDFLAAREGMYFLTITFVYSRVLSGLLSVTVEKAKKDGMLAEVVADNGKSTIQKILVLEGLLCIAGMLALNMTIGGCLVAATLIYLFLYGHSIQKEFGGVTGDLAGYLLCMTELISILVIALCYGLGWC